MNQREFSCSLAVSFLIAAAPSLGHGLELAPGVPKIGAAFPTLAVPAAGSVAAPSLNQLPVLNAATIPPTRRSGVVAPTAAASEQIHQALVHGGLHTADALFRGLYDFGQFDRYQVPVDPVAASDGFGGGRGGWAPPPRKRTGGGGGSGHSGPRIEFADSVPFDHREHLTSALHAHFDQLVETLGKLGIPPDHVHNVLLHVDSAQPAESEQVLRSIHYSITVTVHKAHGKLKANFREVLKAAVLLPEGSLALSLAAPVRISDVPSSQLPQLLTMAAQRTANLHAIAGQALEHSRPQVEFADSVPAYDREWLTSALRAHLDQLAAALAQLGIPLNEVNHVSLRVDSAQYGTARAKVDGVMRSLPSVHYSIAAALSNARVAVLKAVVVLPEGKLTVAPAPSEDRRLGADERLDFLTPPQRYLLRYRGIPLTPEELQRLREALGKIGARIVQDDDSLSSPMLLVEGDATLIQSVLSSRPGWTSSEYKESLVPLPSLHPSLPPLALPARAVEASPETISKIVPSLREKLKTLAPDQTVSVIITVIFPELSFPPQTPQQERNRQEDEAYETLSAPIRDYLKAAQIEIRELKGIGIIIAELNEVHVRALAALPSVANLALNGKVHAADTR